MIRNPINVTISPELARLVTRCINDPELEGPVTLGHMRKFAEALLPSEFGETESMHHIDEGASLLDELDELIGEYGEEANAADFLENEASEALSRVIEAAVEEAENPPTLDDVKEAVFSGLAARLVAEGALEDDEDETVIQELDDLIERFGADAMAEDFLRYD